MTKETAKAMASAMLENVTKELQQEHLQVSIIVANACNNELPASIKALIGTPEGKEYLRTQCYVYWSGYSTFSFANGVDKVRPYVITDKNMRTPRIPEEGNCYNLIQNYLSKEEKLQDQKKTLGALLFKLKTEKRILEHFPESAEVIAKFFPAKNTDVLVINDSLKQLVKCSIVEKQGCEIK